jgi:hypothetical protein
MTKAIKTPATKLSLHREVTIDEPSNEPALGGGILIAPGVSLWNTRSDNFMSPVWGDRISVARFAGSRSLVTLIPGLTPGATFCRRLRRLVECSFSKMSPVVLAINHFSSSVGLVIALA